MFFLTNFVDNLIFKKKKIFSVFFFIFLPIYSFKLPSFVLKFIDFCSLIRMRVCSVTILASQSKIIDFFHCPIELNEFHLHLA